MWMLFSHGSCVYRTRESRHPYMGQMGIFVTFVQTLLTWLLTAGSPIVTQLLLSQSSEAVLRREKKADFITPSCTL